MSKESGVVICPNPKCHRKIEEPILLNNLSTTPAEQYQACPHCFIKLDADAKKDEDTKQESTRIPSTHPSLEKVLDAISSQPQTEIEENEEKKEEEPPVKPPKKEEEEPPVKPPEKEGKGPSGCTHHFGYLTNRPRDAPIPQECLTCPKIVDCMLKLRDS